MTFVEKLANEGFVVRKMTSSQVVGDVNRIIDDVVPEEFADLSTDQFRDVIFDVQSKVNERKMHHQFVAENREFFTKLFGSDDYSITSVVHVRGVRPMSEEPVEFLDFHREAFYSDGDYINHQLNIQVPLRNYTAQTSMYYIPRSHLISDDELVLEKKDSSYSNVERFSTGHKIGLSYNPKRIVGGINFEHACRFNIESDEFITFTSKLIHGAGENNSDCLRFSMDFGLIPDVKMTDVKEFHFSSYSDSKGAYEKPLFLR